MDLTTVGENNTSDWKIGWECFFLLLLITSKALDVCRSDGNATMDSTELDLESEGGREMQDRVYYHQTNVVMISMQT